MTKLMVLLPHLASVCDSNLQPDNNNSMIVMVPTLDDCWYLDSGATNHVISDLNDLSFGSNNHGTNKIHIRNGAGLVISNVGHYFFPVPLLNLKLYS